MNLKKLKTKVANTLSQLGSALTAELSPKATRIALLTGVLVIAGVLYNNYSDTYSTSSDITATPVAAPNSSKSTSSSESKRFTMPKGRTVILSGEVGEQSREVAERIAKLAKEDGTSPIYLLLNSPGGSVLDGILVIQAIQASKAPVVTVCTQICASMAAMIFEYGSTRYLGNKAFLMFHPASAGAQGELDKIVSRLTFFQSLISGIEAEIATRAGVSYSQYKVWSSSELWLFGEQAVKQGFADSIVVIEGSEVFSRDLSFMGASENVRRATKNMQKIDITW